MILNFGKHNSLVCLGLVTLANWLTQRNFVVWKMSFLFPILCPQKYTNSPRGWDIEGHFWLAVKDPTIGEQNKWNWHNDNFKDYDVMLNNKLGGSPDKPPSTVTNDYVGPFWITNRVSNCKLSFHGSYALK